MSKFRLTPGQTFVERYVIGEILGKGGMGAVYRARDTVLGEDVALKIISPLADASPTLVPRFRQEVKLARRITHPNVVRVHDLGEVDGMMYMTMEVIVGKTLLATLRQEKRLPPIDVARIGAAIGHGLAAAHAVGVVHRDLKPANVLIANDGRVTLTDFGIARNLLEESDLTQDGNIVGTMRYLAPEQISRHPVITPHTDLYSLGLLLGELLIGEVPERHKPLNLLQHGLLGKAVEQLQLVLNQCLETDPAKRPDSAATVARTLEAIAAGEKRAEDELPTQEMPMVMASKSSGSPATLIQATNHPPGRTLGPNALAILPFQYTGDAEHTYLGQSIAAELVDMLAMIPTLRVVGAAVTQAFAESRNPLAIGQGLGVAMVLDGALQVASQGQVRAIARLVDTATGVQLWSERHDGKIGDLLTFQTSVARKIAEQLRMEISLRAYHARATPEAIEYYMRARRYTRGVEPDAILKALSMFERCLELAPQFAPALAGYAITSVRRWFFDLGLNDGTELATAAEQSLTRALSEASELAETHFAAALFNVQRGDLPNAASALHRSLALAPMYLEALEYAGMLQCEAGYVEQGLDKLQLAADLDPTRAFAIVNIARVHGLTGEYDQADGLLEEAMRRAAGASLPAALTMMRLAAWRGKPSRLPAMSSGSLDNNPRWWVVKAYLQALWRQIAIEDVEAVVTRFFAVRQSSRARASFLQLVTEIWLLLEQPERALASLGQSGREGLFDVLWLAHCPLLDALRRETAFAEVLRRATLRAEVFGD